MSKGQSRRRYAALVLSWLTVFSANGLPNSTASAQAPEAKDFRDDFAGTSLRPERTIVDQDANRWALVDNDYLLLVMKNEKNKFCYKNAITDRYEFVLKLLVSERLQTEFYSTGAFGSRWELFYIGINNAKSEGVKMMISTSQSGKEVWVFEKRVGDDRATLWKEGGKVSGAETEYYLKIRKVGVEYTGYVSHDGNSWTEVGIHYFPGFSGTPCFGGISNTGTEKGVKVDFAELKALK